MGDEPRIYYPYQLDYRGRAYAVPQTIHPQADPVGKGPLEFKDGKPLEMGDVIKNPDLEPPTIQLQGELVVRESCGAHLVTNHTRLD